MPKPCVILIGGAPLAGKTSIAQGLARVWEMDAIATDDLLSAVRAATNADTHPALHGPVDGAFRDYFPVHAPDRLLEDALAFHRAAWPVIEAVVTSRTSGGRPAVIEGWGILPELVADLEPDVVAALFLVPDEVVYARRCRADASFYEGVADEERLIEAFARRSVLFGRMLKESASARRLPVVEPGLRTSVEEIVERVRSLLRP